MRRSHKVLLIIFSLLLWMCALALGGELLVFLSYASLLFWLVPVLHGLAGLMFLSVTISMPARTLACGETLVISYRIKNRSIIPFPVVRLESLINKSLNAAEQEALFFSLAGRESVQWETSIECKRRGVYTTGNVRMTVKNIYGVGEFTKVFFGALSLTVYPRVIKLRSLGVGATRQSGELIVTDPLCRNHSELSSLGLWRPGISLKHIHWKASARTGEWLVKDYEMRGDSEIMILVDCCSSDYRNDHGRMLEDSVVSLVVAIVDFLLSRSVYVTLSLIAPGCVNKIIGTAEADIPRFLEAMAGFTPAAATRSAGPQNFAALLESAAHDLRDGSSALVIGPCLDKATAIQGMQLQFNNHRPKFLVVGRNGVHTPKDGLISFNARILNSEGIPVQFIDSGEDIRETVR